MTSAMTMEDAKRVIKTLFSDDTIVHALLRFGTLRTYRQGRALVYQGDVAEFAYLVLDGRFSCHKYRSDDSIVPLPALTRGRWCAVAECLQKGNNLYEVTAMETSSVLAFSLVNFSNLRLQLASFDSMVLLPSLAQELHNLHGHLADANPLDKLVSYLLSQRRSLGGISKQSIHITQAELGRSIGCTRETVNKYLGMLASRGLVELERSSIVVQSWEALADYH